MAAAAAGTDRIVYKSILQNFQDSMLNEQIKSADARRKGDAEFLNTVKCSKEIMRDIDAMYDGVKADYLLEVKKLDVRFGDVRKSRDEFIQSLINEQLKARKEFDEVTSTLSKVHGMPLLKTCTSNVERDVESMLEDVMARREYIDTILKDFDAPVDAPVDASSKKNTYPFLSAVDLLPTELSRFSCDKRLVGDNALIFTPHKVADERSKFDSTSCTIPSWD